MLDHFFRLLFPKVFRIYKNIGHPTSGSGGEKTVKKDQKPKKTEKSEEKNFFLRGDFRQFSKKNVQKDILKSQCSPIQETRPKMCKNKGTNLSRNLTRKQILSPGLENSRTLERISDSFPGTLTYMLFLENCWNSAPMCSFSPIQGTMSWLVLKFHVTRIWELDISKPRREDAVFLKVILVHLELGDIYNWVKSKKSNFQVWRPPRLLSIKAFGEKLAL